MIRRIVPVLLAVLLLLAGACTAASAAGSSLTLTFADGPETVIVSREKGKDSLLFVPGNRDLSRVTLTMAGQEILYLGEEKTAAAAGETVDLSRYAGKRIPVAGAKGTTLTWLRVMQGSEVPSLFLTTDAKEMSAVRKSKDNVITDGQVLLTEADGSVTYAGPLKQLKGRGNSTFAYSKKPYELKLPEAVSPAGIPAGKTWVLLANYVDISLLRNQIVLDTAREIGLPYSVKCVQTDVWINGEYQGLYLMTEKVQIKKNRIAIRNLEEETEKLNPEELDTYPKFRHTSGTLKDIRGYRIPEEPEDVTGGFIFKIEKLHRFNNVIKPGFETEGRLCIRIIEPTCPGEAATEYLAARVADLHSALISKDGTSPETGTDYREYLDLDSFACKFLLEEWCKNFDFLGGSQYMYKDSDATDPLIYAGPAWDYDLCFGNMEERGQAAEGDYMTSQSRRPGNLYWLLTTHASFNEKARDIWTERFRPAMDILLGETAGGEDHVLKSIDEYAEQIRRSAEMNFERWGVNDQASRQAGGSFDNAVAYLKKWIRTRVNYMDTEKTRLIQ